MEVLESIPACINENNVTLIKILKPPLPEATLLTHSGWLSPQGVLYPCETGDHSWLLALLYYHLKIRNFDSAGWVKLRDNEWFDVFKYPTPAQITTIFDWCALHKYPLPEFIK